MNSGLSIVMPVLDEAETIVSVLQGARRACPGAEIVLVDGGSTDDTVAKARGLPDLVISSPPGRARQMNTGADAVFGDVILFLHADTQLPHMAEGAILDAIASGADWGRFDVRIEGRPAILRLVGPLMNARSRLTGVATGDQAIFVTKAAFVRVGGFSDIPLMEDIDLSKRLRRISRPACLHSKAVTSGRRWEANGPLRTIVTMWALRLAYWLGVSPRTLAEIYGRLKAR
ncbi:Glycosyltransferase involved in cell wall biogenesis [Fulvimarina pelagi HTCC2506]|uniref:Glycosyltransferase involved in cell wall biogenesis n=1 Tax=Fulvimarina pelagi HTCC2506 TaxID=314231 RepID=Q0FXD8_9HYPH|nr:TIGR04283 family arsenosugar biosynthesis glycosyltransferase [Fulvimarina pelagi]EAU39661.1 Glycosyltransferase involved in cell wall biogenesis [Fulvimarina pelagi HTCC2506]